MVRLSVGTTTTTNNNNVCGLTGGIGRSLKRVQFLPFGVWWTINKMIGHGKKYWCCYSPVYQAEAEALAQCDGEPKSLHRNPLFTAVYTPKHMVYIEKYRINDTKLSMYRVFESRCISQGTYLYQTIVNHRPSRTSTSPTGRLHSSHHLSSEQHNDLELDHSLSYTFLTNIGPLVPANHFLILY